MQINIGFSIDDNYSQHCGTLIASILKSSISEDSYKFYIVHKFISDENKAKFEELKKIKNFEIEYLKIDDTFFQTVKFYEKLRVEQFYRFFLFSLTDINKILYLDSDLIVRHDIGELFRTNIDNYYIAGVEDIVGKSLIEHYKLSPTTTYVNSGVLLINLEKTRQVNHFDFIKNLPIEFSSKNFGDQDIINYIYQDKILPLDLKWNFSYPYRTTYSNPNYYHMTSKNPSIVHYITDQKPWVAGTMPYKKEEYFKYAKLTPWFKDFIDLYIVQENQLIFKKLDEILKKLG